METLFSDQLDKICNHLQTRNVFKSYFLAKYNFKIEDYDEVLGFIQIMIFIKLCKIILILDVKFLSQYLKWEVLFYVKSFFVMPNYVDVNHAKKRTKMYTFLGAVVSWKKSSNGRGLSYGWNFSFLSKYSGNCGKEKR